MNGIKKVLFLVIAIEGTVLLYLLAVKIWDSPFEKVHQNLIINSTTSLPKVSIKQSISKDKERALQIFLKKSLTSLTDFLSEQGNSTFLYSKEIHQKKREAVEKYSKNFLGRPYVWGATGPKSFDCSGFTQKVYRRWGIKLPRHST